MFGGYKFGDVTKNVYKKASSSTSSRNKDKTNAPGQAKGYRFGDLSKSAVRTVSTKAAAYTPGDLTKSAIRSITKSKLRTHEPFDAKITRTRVTIHGSLIKCSAKLRTRQKYSAVLEGHRLFLLLAEPHLAHLTMDAFYKRSHRCAEKLDLTVFDRVVRIDNAHGPKATTCAFELRSADDSRRFIAPSIADRRKWIRMIMSTLSALRLRVLDVQRLRIAPKEYASDVTTLDMQFIAHYLIDLQCEHALSGNPRALLNNQNFVIAAAIWSFASDASAYVHSEQYTSTVYQVAAHGTERAVKGATSIAVATTGAMAGAVAGAAAGPAVFPMGCMLACALCRGPSPSVAEKLAVAGCSAVIAVPAVPLGAVGGAFVGGICSFHAVDEQWKIENEL